MLKLCRHVVAFRVVLMAPLWITGCVTTATAGLAGTVDAGREALAEGRVDRAIAELEARLTAVPQDLIARRLLAQAFARKGNFSKAAVTEQTALTQEPSDRAGWRRVGDWRHALGDCPAAVAAYKHLDGGPEADEPAVAVRVAECEVQQGRGLDAERRLRVALARHGDTPAGAAGALWLGLARALAAQGQPDRAVRAYEEAARRLAKDPAPLYELGLVYEALDLVAPARKAFAGAVERDPSHVQALMRLGRALLDLHDPASAVVVLEKAHSLDPQDAALSNNLGVAYLAAERTADAVRIFEAAVKGAGKRSATSWSNLAEAHYKRGAFSEAQAALQETVRLEPGRNAEQGALRRVAVAAEIVATRCELSRVPSPVELESRLSRVFAKAGWPASELKDVLAALLGDAEGKRLLDLAMTRCLTNSTSPPP